MIKGYLRNLRGRLRAGLGEDRASRLKRQYWDAPNGSVVNLMGYQVRIVDGPNFYMQYKGEFIHRNYHFSAETTTPNIIDGGSNMGMSILYFKHVYPQSK